MSTSSASSAFQQQQQQQQQPAQMAPPHFKPHQPSNFCIKKGKWYDCLRPVPGYTDFGGIGADRKQSVEGEEDEYARGQIQDYSMKTPSLFKKSKKEKTAK